MLSFYNIDILFQYMRKSKRKKWSKNKRKIISYDDNPHRWDGKMLYTFQDKINMFFMNLPYFLMILIPICVVLYFLDISIVWKLLIIVSIVFWYIRDISS